MSEPIVNLALPLYIDGLNPSVASATVIAIAPGQARDSLDQLDMPVGYPNYAGGVLPAPMIPGCTLPQPLFVNSAVVGANGLDQGVLAVSSNYIIYLIADASGFLPVAGLLSLYSNAAPLLPFGYSSYRVIGYVSTDTGPSFLSGSIIHSRFQGQYYLQPPISVLSGGNATTFTAVSLSSAIPTGSSTFVVAYLEVIFTPAAVGDNVQFRPTGSTATANLPTIVGVQAGVTQTNCIAVMTGTGGTPPSIDYKVSSSSDSVNILVEGYQALVAD